MAMLNGKVAIITGSTGGIGAGVARRFAVEGAKVVVNGRNEEAGQGVVKEIIDAGGEAVFCEGSVMSEADMQDVLRRALDRFGRVDTMVASAAGVDPSETRSPKARGLFHEIQVDAVVDVIAKSTTGKLIPAQVAAKHFVAQGSGSIVFITSEGGRAPTAGQTGVSFYAGGLVMGTKVLAKELARHKVRVNCIAVTLVADTMSWDGRQGKGEMTALHRAQYAKIQERAPLGVAKPDDVGALAAFLASSGADYITGAAVSATGGLTFP